MKTKYELADVVRSFGKELLQIESLSPRQTKTLFDMVQCRTAWLGGHEEACDCCGTVRYSYNSCGNRHCPKCQAAKQVKWIDKLIDRTLPIRHYHVVFTVPHCLNMVCLWNNKLYYKILFSAVWRTLHSFGYSHYGVESGAIAVLHSWGQNLSLHPHIHCLVPAAGYTLKGKWKNIGVNGKYLYPVQQLSSCFKAKFLKSLELALLKEGNPNGFSAAIDQAWNKKWVVYSEPSMAGSEHVIRYLGQYTHRVAISNQNITNITDTHVEFITKDYRDKAKKKPARLTGFEFLRRFCQHILPQQFVKIRYFGIYNGTTKRSLKLQFTQPSIDAIEKQKLLAHETAADCLKRVLGIDVTRCPVCKKGTLHKI
ncbi:MAG: IS91 family transposase, partial [Prolixibacteraceae bacterium]|nr:IS91 family transposase [Prolixibacteraceae bacterium]